MELFKQTIKENRKKIEDVLLTDYGCFDEFTVDKLCDLSIVSQQRELLDLLTEIANSDTLYSNTRHRMMAKKLLKSNCG